MVSVRLPNIKDLAESVNPTASSLNMGAHYEGALFNTVSDSV